MDLVIMNPPFTRDSLRYDQFGIAEELAVKERETELNQRSTPIAACCPATLVRRSFLVVLGEKMLATVDESAPSPQWCYASSGITDKAAGNLSPAQVPCPSRFHVETIVSSHDPERIYFSENTSIGEVLIICRRWTEKRAESRLPA